MMEGESSAEVGCGSERSPHMEVEGVCAMQRSDSSALLLVGQLQDGTLPTRSCSARSAACVERGCSPTSAAAGRRHSTAWQRACNYTHRPTSSLYRRPS
jgi:hypothetical protein